MANDWILDVLADLRAFSSLNGMPRLAEHLDDATLAAAAEIAVAKGIAEADRGDGHAVVMTAAMVYAEGSERIADGAGVRRNA